ncbi:MAG: GDP-mannose 4,6-dehydratase [Bacteroidales bacterium]
MSLNSKALIFGSGGQDGYYLSKALKKRKIDIIGISIDNADLIGDISEYDFVFNQIRKYNPTYIFHLAAFSTTKHDAIFKNHLSISTGTLNILEAVRLLCPECKVFITGSAMQFENNGLPIDEKTPFEPSSAYSVARIHSVFASRYYRKEYGLKVYIGYLFNHDSPLRPESHINQKIVSSVKRIAAGSTEKLELGDIDVKKEFNYAADIVEAVWILINQDKVFEAVIGNGEAHSIREWVEYCFSKINKRWQDYVILNEKYISEYKILVSNPALIKSLGWMQKVSFKQLADLMMSDDRL